LEAQAVLELLTRISVRVTLLEGDRENGMEKEEDRETR
jgi:hypothetical protein